MIHLTAYIGIIALFVGAATVGLKKFGAGAPRLGAGVGALLLLVCCGLTWQQSRTYHNIETLWRATLAHNPDAFIASNNLGKVLNSQNRSDEAIPLLEHALELSE